MALILSNLILDYWYFVCSVPILKTIHILYISAFPVTWSNIHVHITNDDKFTLAHVMFTMLFDTFMYFALEWFISSVCCPKRDQVRQVYNNYETNQPFI